MSQNELKTNKKRVLFVSNILAHIKTFHTPYINWFRENGWEVHVLSNANGEEKPLYCDYLYDVPIRRSPFDRRNIKAYKIAKNILDENHYDIIHCHTPMGGIVGRLASIKSKKRGTRVIYTAHGFHFYKGAPIFNWLFFFPAELIMSRFTDTLITINHEDYSNARKYFSNRKGSLKIHHIFGIGVDSKKFNPIETSQKNDLKRINGYENNFVITYVAEYIKRKNHKLIIDMVKIIKENIPEIKILFAGKGELMEETKLYAKENGVYDLIEFLGFRKDIETIYQASDIVISSCNEEGLGLNIAEGMFTGLPAVASNVRGHREMIVDGYNGFLFEINNANDMANKIVLLYNDRKLLREMSLNSKESIQKFSIKNSLESMTNIYEEEMLKIKGYNQ